MVSVSHVEPLVHFGWLTITRLVVASRRARRALTGSGLNSHKQDTRNQLSYSKDIEHIENRVSARTTA